MRGWIRRLGVTPVGAVAAAVLLGYLLVAILGPLLLLDAASETGAPYSPSSAAHLFGTDARGRDILLRLLVATGPSLAYGMLATLFGVALGLIIGACAALLPSRAGRIVAAAIDVLVAFPSFLLAVFFAAILGVGSWPSALAIGIGIAPAFARITSTLAYSVVSRDYIAAARLLGIGRIRIAIRHVFPNIGEPLLINATSTAGASLIAISGLSFLGLGVQAPDYDWGTLLSNGVNSIYLNPMGAIGPAIFVVVAALALSLSGEFAADLLRRRGASLHAPDSAALLAEESTVSSRTGLLVAESLAVRVNDGEGGWREVVHGIDLCIAPGEAVGIIGESGSGKTMTALALTGLTEDGVAVAAARLEFDGIDVLGTTPEQLRRRVGTSMPMIFQDPMSSLTPTLRLGAQLIEGPRTHEGLSRRDASDRALRALRALRLPDPERRMMQHPHQLSGGQRQRVMIAMGLVGEPRLIIADEPTTALDSTVQRAVLQALLEARNASGAALLLISHDLGVVSAVCDRVLVMRDGRIVEELRSEDLRERARHPYTRALLRAAPDLSTPKDRPLPLVPEPGDDHAASTIMPATEETP